MVVHERRDPDGRLTGYAVGRPDHSGHPANVFGGGRLAADLPAPSSPPLGPRRHIGRLDFTAAAKAGPGEREARSDLWSQASTAVAQAADIVRPLLNRLQVGRGRRGHRPPSPAPPTPSADTPPPTRRRLVMQLLRPRRSCTR